MTTALAAAAAASVGAVAGLILGAVLAVAGAASRREEDIARIVYLEEELDRARDNAARLTLALDQKDPGP